MSDKMAGDVGKENSDSVIFVSAVVISVIVWIAAVGVFGHAARTVWLLSTGIVFAVSFVCKKLGHTRTYGIFGGIAWGMIVAHLIIAVPLFIFSRYGAFVENVFLN